jgi:CheY-like chemotaxis protein/AraC-like DNA-binding protein
MVTFDSSRAARFTLVTAAQRLILSLKLLRDSRSRRALASFADQAVASRLSSADVDAVLLRVLSVLDPIVGRLPSLVERYLAARRLGGVAVGTFQTCVDEALRYRGVGDPIVQRAIAILEDEYRKPDFGTRALARTMGISEADLCVRFKRQTGMKIGARVRCLRLDRAAELLLKSDRETIKEVWVEVGYNYAANFDHDFKRRFGLSPREYRARAIASPDATAETSRQTAKAVMTQRRSVANDSASASIAFVRHTSRTALVVDDDEGTREIVSLYLRKLHGYDVVTVPNGAQALTLAPRAVPDVVLIDYHMEGMDGLMCLRELRRHLGNRPKFILWSADWDLEIAQGAAALGAMYMEKCCDLDEIVRSA